MKSWTGARVIAGALLAGALLLAGCATHDMWDCYFERTCDGQVRAGVSEVCSDQGDLTLAVAWAVNTCENILSQECGTHSCNCRCFEDWGNGF